MIKNCHCGNTVSGGFLSLCLTHLGELLSELVQFLLQRSLLLLSGSHLVTNLTNLSGDASCNSNTSGLSSCNIGALCLKRGGESPLVSLNHTELNISTTVRYIGVKLKLKYMVNRGLIILNLSISWPTFRAMKSKLVVLTDVSQEMLAHYSDLCQVLAC